MIEFGKGYWIKTDKYCFIVLKENKDKNGNIIYKELTYHTTLEGLLKSLGNRFVRGVKNPQELKELKETLNEFNNICKNIGKEITISELQKEYDKNRDEINARSSNLWKNKNKK